MSLKDGHPKQAAMQMHWEIACGEAGYVAIKTSGGFTAHGQALLLKEIISKDYWRPGMRALFDHRELDFGKADFKSMSSAGRSHKTHDARIGKTRTAILCRPGIAYASIRQFLAITEGDISADIQLFTEEAAALKWLLLEEEAEESGK